LTEFESDLINKSGGLITGAFPSLYQEKPQQEASVKEEEKKGDINKQPVGN